ncbi:MAG: hypothetical protein MJ072_05030, partial [Clostridia bacterium]|nr:hypothetical protein [Clostridia bacterium]
MSYKEGTDEAKKIFQNALKNMLNINLTELYKASQSVADSLEYIDRHFVEIEAAYDIKGIMANGHALSPEFEQFVTNNMAIIETISGIRDKVDMASSNMFMAGVYDSPAFKDPSSVGFVFGLPDGNNMLKLISTTSRAEQVDEDIRILADASVRLGGSVLTDKKSVDPEGKEIPKKLSELDGEHLSDRKKEDYALFRDPVVMSGSNYNRIYEYRRLFIKEIHDTGINGKGYDSLSGFVDKNTGGIFNTLFNYNSESYNNLVDAINLFERKMSGDETAFPEGRADTKMMPEDYLELKGKFDAYIAHKQQQLAEDKKTEFKANSVDDNRYKFALKMPGILQHVAGFYEFKETDFTTEFKLPEVNEPVKENAEILNDGKNGIAENKGNKLFDEKDVVERGDGYVITNDKRIINLEG